MKRLVLSGAAALLLAGNSMQGKEIEAAIESRGGIKTEPVPTYQAWPTVMCTKDGELLAVCSGNRKEHVDPFGRVMLYRSADGGKTWSEPKLLTKGPLDDRDAGIVQAADGSLLVNYFTSIGFAHPRSAKNLQSEWKESLEKISLADIVNRHGFFMIRSTDHGATWSEPYSVPVNSVHGPKLLKSGRLIWVGRSLAPDYVLPVRMGDKMVCAVSDDHGATWSVAGEISPVKGQLMTDWHEADCVEAADGTIIAQFRNHTPAKTAPGNKAWPRGIWQTESADGGKTWSVPHHICDGFPPHLLRLPDGRLLLTYSYRSKPFGIRFRLSDDNGKSWSKEGNLADTSRMDMGYPSTVVLKDGSLFTLYYEADSDKLASLSYIRWRLPAKE